MKPSRKEQLMKFMEDIQKSNVLESGAVPSMGLYMDQVTTYMDSILGMTRRSPQDKLLTKTMINNYTKNHLLPPPDRKKYSAEHLMRLISIYLFKEFLSIGDIATIMELAEREEDNVSFQELYDTILREIDGIKEEAAGQILADLERAGRLFPEEDAESRDSLQLLSFISMLGFDVYIKKQIIEHLLDDMKQ